MNTLISRRLLQFRDKVALPDGHSTKPLQGHDLQLPAGFEFTLVSFVLLNVHSHRSCLELHLFVERRYTQIAKCLYQILYMFIIIKLLPFGYQESVPCV